MFVSWVNLLISNHTGLHQKGAFPDYGSAWYAHILNRKINTLLDYREPVAMACYVHSI